MLRRYDAPGPLSIDVAIVSVINRSDEYVSGTPPWVSHGSILDAHLAPFARALAVRDTYPDRVHKTDRRRQQGEASRISILDATLALASRRGYDGTSIALVSDATGLPASSIYWHFTNKDELLAETVEYSYVTWRASAPAADFPVDHETPSRVIKDRLTRAAVTIAGSPHFWRLGLMLSLRSDGTGPIARERYLEVRERSADGMREWYLRLFPRIDQSLAERITRCHLAMIDGLYVNSFSDSDWYRNGSGERLLGMLSEGLHTTVLRWMDPA